MIELPPLGFPSVPIKRLNRIVMLTISNRTTTSRQELRKYNLQFFSIVKHTVLNGSTDTLYRSEVCYSHSNSECRENYE